jgi:hypothetical protein
MSLDIDFVPTVAAREPRYGEPWMGWMTIENEECERQKPLPENNPPSPRLSHQLIRRFAA